MLVERKISQDFMENTVNSDLDFNIIYRASEAFWEQKARISKRSH